MLNFLCFTCSCFMLSNILWAPLCHSPIMRQLNMEPHHFNLPRALHKPHFFHSLVETRKQSVQWLFGVPNRVTFPGQEMLKAFPLSHLSMSLSGFLLSRMFIDAINELVTLWYSLYLALWVYHFPISLFYIIVQLIPSFFFCTLVLIPIAMEFPSDSGLAW